MAYFLYHFSKWLGIEFVNPVRYWVDDLALLLKNSYDFDYMSPLEYLTRQWDLGEWGLEWLWLLIFFSTYNLILLLRFMKCVFSGGRTRVLGFFFIRLVRLDDFPSINKLSSYFKVILWSLLFAWFGLTVVYGIAYLIYGHNSKSIAVLFIWWLFYVWYPFGGLQRVDEQFWDWIYQWLCFTRWLWWLDWATVFTQICDSLCTFDPLMLFNATRLTLS